MAANPSSRPEPAVAQSDKLHSFRAEQALLGAMLLVDDAWDRAAGLVSQDDFHHPRHGLLFGAIGDLRKNGVAADLITLGDRLRQAGKLEEAGGESYLLQLNDSAIGAANLSEYANIVREYSLRRKLAEFGDTLARNVRAGGTESAEELLEQSEKSIFALGNQRIKGDQNCQPLSNLLKSVVEQVDQRYHSKNRITGIATGFAGFDDETSGLQATDLIVVAGRPSMGKTAFALNVATHAAIHGKLNVCIFSMEMSAVQLAMRILSSLARIDQKKLRSGDLSDDDFVRISSTVAMMESASIFIDDSPALSPSALAGACRRLARREGGLDLVVVDYLQLMHVPSSKENRATEISEISRGLKSLAKELNLPVIALSQLNRSVESRNPPRPMMSDLRESGAIEQDADVIVFLYRASFYKSTPENEGEAEVIIGKQRNGPVGIIPMRFMKQYTLFADKISDAVVPHPGGYDPAIDQEDPSY
ncbi:MAG: replicative DNA helicase [Candidatus Porifericomitaceae bacterium WSBS_2022_MAG_OTU9]